MRRAQRGLRRLVIAGCLLAPAAAWGGDLGPSKVTLTLSAEQAMLIAQTLGQVGGCDRVSGMATCETARALIREIQEQVKAQERK